MDCERDGEFGSGEMRGAIFAAGEELDGELPPRKRPLIPENRFDILDRLLIQVRRLRVLLCIRGKLTFRAKVVDD